MSARQTDTPREQGGPRGLAPLDYLALTGGLINLLVVAYIVGFSLLH